MNTPGRTSRSKINVKEVSEQRGDSVLRLLTMKQKVWSEVFSGYVRPDRAIEGVVLSDTPPRNQPLMICQSTR